MKFQRPSSWLASAFLPLALAAGCAMFDDHSHHRASSLVEYLYPKDARHIEEPGLPVLSLPLKVGIAFVPERKPGDEETQFSEKQKLALIKEVSDNFKKYPFVHSIELIPSSYLLPHGGFANLDQLHSMFGIDVIALVSYDQVQFTGEGLL